MSKISQKMALKQQLSPQQVLQASLLQLNLPLLEQRILHELEINPALELIDLSSDADSLEKFCTGIWELVCTHPKTQKHSDSYARVSAISKDSFEIACNIYWDVSGGNEEKDAREKLLLDVSRLAKDLELDFFEPRVRASRE